MSPRRFPWVCLSVLAASLASGCCPPSIDDEDLESYDVELEGELDEETFEALVFEEEGWHRCYEACEMLARREMEMITEIEACDAEGDVKPDKPWDLANETVYVTCSGHYQEAGEVCM